METTLARRLWEDARQRPTNVRPSGLPLPLRVVAIATWVAAAIMLAFGFIPGLFSPEGGSLYDGALQFEYAPVWPLLSGIALGSGAAAIGYVCTATTPGAPRHHAVLAWCSGIAIPLIPILVLTIDRGWQVLPAAAAWLAASALVIAHVHVRRRTPGPWVGLLLACLVAAPWIPAIYANIRFGLALDSGTASDSELTKLLVADLAARIYVPGVALAFVAAMATGGLALAAQSRAAVAHQLARHRGAWRTSAVICLVAVGVLALEVSGTGGIDSGFLDTYWDLGDAWTWPHAVAVAAAIVYVTRRSFTTPLLQRGDVTTALAIGLSTLSGHIVIALAMIVNLIAGAIIGPDHSLIGVPAGLGLLIAWLSLATLVPVAIRDRWRGTVGRSVARVGLLFLVPVYLGVTAHALGFVWTVSFWAKAPQVAICLTVFGCIATMFGLLGKMTAVPPEMVNRLVLIPLLIVSGTSWLPNFIATPLTPVIAVTAALFALLWALPADTGMRHSGTVLAVSAQLLLVAAAAGIITQLADGSGDDPVLALLLFSVPLTTLLCAKVTSEFVNDATGPPPLPDTTPTPRSQP
ncbi:hypothetical protein BH11ACT6_BH11ACT6_37300 [soil metagenome]